MDDLFLVSGLQGCGDLVNNIECQCHWHRSPALDNPVQRFALHEFHGVEIVTVLLSKMKNRGDVRVAKASRGTSLTDKSEARRFIVQVARIDYFERHRATKIAIEGPISHTHRTATQLDRRTVVVG